MAGNTSTKKQFSDKEDMPIKARPSKTATQKNTGSMYEGQIYDNEKYAEPLNKGAPAHIGGLDGLHDDIGEKSGFITQGYLDKGNMPFGEAAKYNFLPPGMDISNQENSDIREMKLRKITEMSYPDDGWMPAPRDIPE